MPENPASVRLDARQPLVVDTRQLNRRPGSLRRLRRSAPAPANLRVGLIGVPPGAAIELDLRLESVMEGVLVTGTAAASVVGECARCLDPVADRIDVDLQQLYAYPASRREESMAEPDADVETLHGDLLDLEPALRDAVVLALPLTPLCRDDCAGLCPDCGERLAEAGAGHAHQRTDSRWAALQDWHADRATDQITDYQQES